MTRQMPYEPLPASVLLLGVAAFSGLSPVFIKCAKNVRAVKLVIPVVESVQKKSSDRSALGVGKQAEVAVIVTGLREAECHTKTVIPAQVCDQVGGKVKPHALGVEEAQAAVATAKCLRRYAMPVVLLVAGTAGSATLGAGVIVKALRLLQTNATAKRNPREGGFDDAADLLS